VVAQAASAVSATMDVEQMLQALLAQAQAPPPFDVRTLSKTDLAADVRTLSREGAWGALVDVSAPLSQASRRKEELFARGTDEGGGELSVSPLQLARFDALLRTKRLDELAAEVAAALDEE
jgi:hypothetical protein